jgi:succinylglutamic semialdehyde dehydrogenase
LQDKFSATFQVPRLSQSAHLISLEPATGALLWQGAISDVESCVKAARAAWPRWAMTPQPDRVEMARRTTRQLRAMGDDLAHLLARETGVPIWEAHGEVDAALNRVEIMIRAQAERSAQRKHDNGMHGITATRHKPHGVMAVISPSSQPLLVPIGQIFPALMLGNAVLFKPSEKAPAVGEAIVACAMRAGLPEGVLQMVVGGPEQGQALALHEEVDGLLFAGSAPVGLGLARKLASRPDRMLRLEMGGSNPIVVWDTPLIDDAALMIVQSAFLGAGQRCTSARRLIVRDTLAEPLLTALRALADRIIVGGSFDDPPPYMGPVSDLAAADGLTQSFIWLMSNGARPIRHLARPNPDLPFLTPGIIDVTDMAQRPDVELFGPLLQVIRVSEFDEAIATANDTQFGLTAALIGGTPQHYGQFWTQVRAGLIHWNKPTTIDLPGQPFGGVGLSGNLRASGAYASDACAFPVASAEVEQPRAVMGTGFRMD